MHQCAMAISESYWSACVHDRSDSRNQNEWICETPCRKNFRASSDEVVTGKFFVIPIAGSSFAGSSGCAPAGVMHMSGGRGAGACLPLAVMSDENETASKRAVARVRCFIEGQYRA